MKIGLLGLSNPCSYTRIEQVKEKIKKEGHEVFVSLILDQKTSGKQRANVWNQWMREDFDWIFDVSGGDLANETIPYLDLDAYARSKAIFCGYSDVTCVLNVLSPIRQCVLFQICNASKMDFLFNYEFIQGQEIKGEIVGGNIRCFLKLAGTPYFPDCKDKVLFLESYSGNENRIRTYFAQLALMGVFQDIKGLILGQFSELDQSGIEPMFYKEYYTGPVARTHEIGHGQETKALWIGKEIHVWEE